MSNIGKSFLSIRCADGRTQRPKNLRGHCLHQIRAPGGMLNPLYRAQNTKQNVSIEVLTALFLEDIETMVHLKNPDEIIVASHHDCGAAAALGLTHQEILQQHEDFGLKLRELFPDITITVMHEMHSLCGEHHGGHQMMAQMQG